MPGGASVIAIGLNGIRILGPPLRLTSWAKFLPAGQEASVLTLVIVGDMDGDAFVDQAEIGPEAPSKP
jgi:hypothetical protein